MSSDTAKEMASVVDSSLTEWKQDFGNSDDPESSRYKGNEDANSSRTRVGGGSFTDRLESSNRNENSRFSNKTRYFIIKSLNYDNIQVSVEKGIWATQVMNEPILEEAFHTSSRVILIFSVNMSGFFQGYAEMTSPVGWRRENIWSQGGGKNNPWGRSFKINWLRQSELPFSKTLHLRNPMNDNKPVKISRDCQELPEDIGVALCELLDGSSCDNGILNRHGYFTKSARLDPQCSLGDEEYNIHTPHLPWGRVSIPYPNFLYNRQDDWSRSHSTQQRYGNSENFNVKQHANNSYPDWDKTYRFNAWGLPAESSLTEDDFLEMSYEEYLEAHSRSMKQLDLPAVAPSQAVHRTTSKRQDDELSQGSSKDYTRQHKRKRVSS